MSSRRPWFLRSAKPRDYSFLQRDDFNELRQAVEEAVRECDLSSRKAIKTAALIALAELAKKHKCTFKFNREGGHICIYKYDEPVFALRIGRYSPYRVEALLGGNAYYRGILEIVTAASLSDISSEEEVNIAEYSRILNAQLEPVKVYYHLLPTSVAGRWKEKEARDLADVIHCLKECPGCSRSYLQRNLELSPNKMVRLLDLLKRRRVVRSRGSFRGTKWYLLRG